MDSNLVAVLAAIAVSSGLQVFKDNISLSPASLRWIGMFLGAVAGGSAGYLGGGDAVSDLAANIAIGSLGTTGFHSLALHKSLLGRILQAIGSTVFSKAPPS